MLQAPGSSVREAGNTDHTPEAVDVWAAELRLRFGGQPIAIALEQSRGPPSVHADEVLDEQYTRTLFYGSRKMTEWLATLGHAANRKRVSRLMELLGIETVYPKPKLSQPGEGDRIYPYLLRGTSVERVNQAWSTDITYIRMAQGFVYLVAVIDWFSRLTERLLAEDRLDRHPRLNFGLYCFLVVVIDLSFVNDSAEILAYCLV